MEVLDTVKGVVYLTDALGRLSEPARTEQGEIKRAAKRNGAMAPASLPPIPAGAAPSEYLTQTANLPPASNGWAVAGLGAAFLSGVALTTWWLKRRS